MSKGKQCLLTVGLAVEFVAFVDDMHAENAVDLDARVARFFAHERLSGGFALFVLGGASQEAIGVLDRARVRYEGLMEGASGGSADECRLAHAQVLLAVRERRYGHTS